MAQQNDPFDLSPTRYSEKRVPQFVGGDTDPTSGNLIPGSKLQAAGTAQPSPKLSDTPSQITDAANLTPATPTTRLGSAGNDFGDMAKAIGTSVAASAISKGFGGNSGSSDNKTPNAGGFSTGGGTGNGGGGPLNIAPSGPTPSTSPLDNTTMSGGSSFSPPGGGNDYSNIPSIAGTDFSYLSAPSAPAAAAPSAPSYSAPSGGGGSYNGGYSPGGDEGGDGGDGGTVVCTYLARKGTLSAQLYRAGLLFNVHHVSAQTIRGYHLWGIPAVRVMQRGGRTGRAFERAGLWLATHLLREASYRVGITKTPDRIGAMLRWPFTVVCWTLGLFVHEQDWRALWDKRLGAAK